MVPKTALLVIDCQMAFREKFGLLKPLPNIINLCEWFSSAGLPIIFTAHGQTSSEMVENSTSNIVKRWGLEICVEEGSVRSEIVPELQIFLPKNAGMVWEDRSVPEAESVEFPKIIAKRTYDSFLDTPLSIVLEKADVERVVICGVCTDVCCDTTARSASARNYETWFVGDACGTATEEQHQKALEAWSFGFKEVIATEEVLARLREA
jgi:nicotinamidase-related amidase